MKLGVLAAMPQELALLESDLGPLIVMRTISDRADHSAAVDFVPFVERVASHFSRGVVRELIARL